MMPLPGRSDRWLSSQPRRSRDVGRVSEPSRRELRASEPRSVRTPSSRAADAELLGHVGDDPRVGGGRGGQDGDAVGHRGDEVGEAAVVGPEVVPPVGDAVRLVDHEQAHPLAQHRQLLLAEARIGEPLGRDQQDVDVVGGQPCPHVVPLVRVGRVDGHGPHARALGRGHLVAHERDERRDQERRAGTLLPEQGRRDEVDRGLAPPGALHHQRAPAVVDQRADGLELALVEDGVGQPGEAAQRFQRGGLGVAAVIVGGPAHSAHRRQRVSGHRSMRVAVRRQDVGRTPPNGLDEDRASAQWSSTMSAHIVS